MAGMKYRGRPLESLVVVQVRMERCVGADPCHQVRRVKKKKESDSALVKLAKSGTQSEWSTSRRERARARKHYPQEKKRG